MRTISDMVIILSGELFVTGCREKANKCVFVAEKLSAQRQLWKTHNNSFGKVCKYINHLPEVLTQFEKAAKEQYLLCWTKVGFSVLKSYTRCICFLTQPLFCI